MSEFLQEVWCDIVITFLGGDFYDEKAETSFYELLVFEQILRRMWRISFYSIDTEKMR